MSGVILSLYLFLVGINGLSIGIDHYGLSAPYKDLAEEFGFTPEKVKKRILDHLNQLL